MGTTWSRWLESDAFNKKRYIDADAQRAFYSSLELAVATIENAVVDEQGDIVGANATDDGDDQEIAQLQYVLENWAREAGTLYDRVGDFPLILPMPSELHTHSQPPIGEQVKPTPSLLSQDELKLASVSGDKLATSERVFSAMKQLAQKLPEDELLDILGKYPRAVRLFVSQQVQAIADAITPFHLLEQSGQSSRAAFHVGKLAYGEEAFVKKMGRLQEMAALLQRAEHAPETSPADCKTASFNRVMTEEMIELIDTQNRLENRLGVMHLIGSSVIETVDKLLTMFPIYPTALRTSVEFAEDFNVHPKQFWWCLIRILSQTNQWFTLFTLSAVVPPPFGLKAIAESLVDAQRADLVPDFIATIVSDTERDAVAAFLELHLPAEPLEGHDEEA